MNIHFCSSEVALTHICNGGKSELLLTQLLKERLRCWEVRTANTGMGLIFKQIIPLEEKLAGIQLRCSKTLWEAS